MSYLEHLRREADNTCYAFRCRQCGAAWKVYQQERHDVGCTTSAALAWHYGQAGDDE